MYVCKLNLKQVSPKCQQVQANKLYIYTLKLLLINFSIMPSKRLTSFCFLLLLFSSISCNRHKELFTSLPASTTKIDFARNSEKRDLFGILYYLYYYNGGGVSIGDINNDGLPDIYFTANSYGNKLYLNKGNFEFEDITDKAGVAGPQTGARAHHGRC